MITTLPEIPEHGIALIDFYATWCDPCRWVEPVLEELKQRLPGNLVIGKIDIEAMPDVAGKFHVQSVPTLVLLVNGTERWRIKGFDTAANMERSIRPFLK